MKLFEKAEAIYTGGGFYIFAGITTDGWHFLAGNDPSWIEFTKAPTMSDELTDEGWEYMLTDEWMDANTKGNQISTQEEADAWLLEVLDYLIDEGCPVDGLEELRDSLRTE